MVIKLPVNQLSKQPIRVLQTWDNLRHTKCTWKSTAKDFITLKSWKMHIKWIYDRQTHQTYHAKSIQRNNELILTALIYPSISSIFSLATRNESLSVWLSGVVLYSLSNNNGYLQRQTKQLHDVCPQHSFGETGVILKLYRNKRYKPNSILGQVRMATSPLKTEVKSIHFLLAVANFWRQLIFKYLVEETIGLFSKLGTGLYWWILGVYQNFWVN